MLWDHLCKDAAELHSNPRLDSSNWGITTWLQNRWEKRPDEAGGGEREGENARMYTQAFSMKTQGWLS